MKTYFRLYAFNIPVRGEKKSAIYNLQFCRIRLIPNSLFYILELAEHAPYEEIRERYTGPDLQTFDGYFDFLLKENLGFFTENPERFPKLSLDWKYPGILQTCVLEYPLSVDSLKDIIGELEMLGCRFLEVRFHESRVAAWQEVLECTADAIFRNIHLIGKYHRSLSEKFLCGLFEAFPKVGNITIYEAPFSEKLKDERVVYTTRRFLDNIPLNKYYINLSFFTESLSYNTYYNKKACIARNGDIKNCLSLTEVFGNVGTDRLSEVVNRKDFQQLWLANADRIADLRGSELRYAVFPAVRLEAADEGTYKIVK